MLTRSVGVAVAVLAALTGCAYDNCDAQRHPMRLDLLGDKGAAIAVFGDTDGRSESVFATVRARIVNRGDQPCRVAFHRDTEVAIAVHTPEGLPFFETVVPGARDGQMFVRFVDAASETRLEPGSELEPFGLPVQEDPFAETIATALQIVVCPEADLQVDVQFDTEVCGPPGRLEGTFDVQRLW